VSKATLGRPGYREALQTREQHARRQQAACNSRTARALLATAAARYAVYHGPVGLTRIASRSRRLAHAFAAGADTAPGAEVLTWEFFDTVALRVADAEAARAVADRAGYNIRVIDSTTIGVSFGEPHTVADANGLLEALGII